MTTTEDLRRWAVEQAIEAGARHDDLVRTARVILGFVAPEAAADFGGGIKADARQSVATDRDAGALDERNRIADWLGNLDVPDIFWQRMSGRDLAQHVRNGGHLVAPPSSNSKAQVPAAFGAGRATLADWQDFVGK